MKTTKKGFSFWVLVPLLFLTMSASAQAEKEWEFLGFTLEDMKMGGIIAAGVAAIIFLAFFTSTGKNKPAPTAGPTAKKTTHHHHRMHKLRR